MAKKTTPESTFLFLKTVVTHGHLTYEETRYLTRRFPPRKSETQRKKLMEILDTGNWLLIKDVIKKAKSETVSLDSIYKLIVQGRSFRKSRRRTDPLADKRTKPKPLPNLKEAIEMGIAQGLTHRQIGYLIKKFGRRKNAVAYLLANRTVKEIRVLIGKLQRKETKPETVARNLARRVKRRRPR